MKHISEFIKSVHIATTNDGEQFELYCKLCVEGGKTKNESMILRPSTPTKFFIKHLKTEHGVEAED